MLRTVSASLLASCLAAATAAQSVGPGLTWQGSLGGSAGSFFPSCVVLPVAVGQGEDVTLRSWGDPQSPFLVAVAFSTIPCTPLPGIGNGLLLGQPLFVLTGGTLTQTTPCLSCPPGLEPFSFTVPAFLPVGFAFTVQGFGFGNGNPSLTVAITATVQ